MGFECRVEADSISSRGNRITTFVVKYPRFIHSEIMTHRMLTKSSASSRAIPFGKLKQRVIDDPVIPIYWGKEQRGMQQGDEFTEAERAALIDRWMLARNSAVLHAETLQHEGLHKSICNRLLEPWMWIEVIITGTEWANFLRLRKHPDAEPHFQKIALMMYEAAKASDPVRRLVHAPFLDETEIATLESAISVNSKDLIDKYARRSAARCARVSYLTHDGKKDPEKDSELADRLVRGSGFGHWAPFEHVCFASPVSEFSAMYWGWKSYRSMCQGENLPGHVNAYDKAVSDQPDLMVSGK